MPAPTADFINGAVDAVVTALEADAGFMALVNKVEDSLPESTEIPVQYLPHAGVAYLRDESNLDESTFTRTALTIDIGIRLYHRGTDRRTVWRTLQQAAAEIEGMVAAERHAGLFGSFAAGAQYLGGVAIDTQEASGYGALLPVRIQLYAYRADT